MEDPLAKVEEAVAALARADPAAARGAMEEAITEDAGLAQVADAVAMMAAQLETEGRIEISAWNALADACPKELQPVIEAHRQ